MIKKLHTRLSVTLLVIFAIIGIFFTATIIWSNERYFLEVTQELNRSIPMYVLDNTKPSEQLIKNGVVDRPAFMTLSNRVMTINPSVELYLVDPDGRVLLGSVSEKLLQRRAIDIEPLQRFIDGPDHMPFKADDPMQAQGEKIFSAASITDDDKLQGYLYTVFGGSQYDRLIATLRWKYITQVAGGAVLCIGLFGFVTALLIFGVLTKRLRILCRAMEDFRRSQFSALISGCKLASKGVAGDELDQLGRSFSIMANKIVEQITELKKLDELRCKLITNISHDLRTPIALIQGYTEAILLKQHDMEDSERAQFLDVIERHSRFLNRMVEQLFELTKLDSADVELRLEVFSITEFAHGFIEKFNLSNVGRSGRRLLIQVLSTDNQADFMVRADVALIERALSNLVDNAMKYASDDSDILLTVEKAHDRAVWVTVKDSGPGIPAEKLAYLFNRTFQVDNLKRRSNTKGAGLGLAIVKRIFELHNSVVSAKSRLGKGSEFAFKLPLSMHKNMPQLQGNGAHVLARTDVRSNRTYSLRPKRW